MQIADEELLELSRCYKCNCNSYPICTWYGEPCGECFDVGSFHHQSPDNRLGIFIKRGQLGRAPPTALHTQADRPLTNTKVAEVKTDASGDCLYDCIAKAFNRYLNAHVSTSPITISDLRHFASRKQNQAMFDAYRSVGHYECLAKVHTLRGFRNVMQQSGSDVGVENCLWGDENTLQIFSDAFHLRIVVFNERGKMIQFIGQEDYSHTLLLRLNRRKAGNEHYTLLEFNDQTILTQNEWFWLKKHLHLNHVH